MTRLRVPGSSLTVFCLTLLLAQCAQSASYHPSHEHILQHVRSSASAADQSAAAESVIIRTIGAEAAAQFNVTIDAALPRNTFRIVAISAAVQITADTGTAACKGFHHYLKYYCQCHLSWDGHQLDRLPGVDRWPECDYRETAGSPVIYYQNVCTWSYSYAWWKWTEWRRHLDWMALNGITLSLAPQQELVWTQIYRELGMQEREIDAHFSGPAFLAWQRMGNMRAWGGPLTEQFKKEGSNLQLQVVAAQRELGMAVALPAFAGHVPTAFRRLFPNSSLTAATRWNRFNDDNCCPLYLDPIDPLFQTIGTMFLRRIIDLYGADNHVYFSDPFNEMIPATVSATYLSQASRSIFAAMQSVDPQAVWLLQAWMFVNPKGLWTPQLAEAFVGAVPRGRLLVLDLQSETQPQYARMQSYFGQPWVWCMLHNFGGTLGMHGSVEVLNTRIAEARQMPNSTMIGFGLTMEGINQNYVVYEFALERGWDQKTVDTKGWFDFYATTRYGRESQKLQAALQHLRTSVYAYNGSIALHGQHIICHRPSLKLVPPAWYNASAIEAALQDLIVGCSNGGVTDMLHYDVVDLTRQFLQTRIDLLYPKLIEALRAKNESEFRDISARFSDYLRDAEAILSTDKRFGLQSWLAQANRWGDTEAERQLLQINARNQITLWGPNGEISDYAIKQWSGVVGDYCLSRWQLFFEVALEAMQRGRIINMVLFRQRVFKDVELPFGVIDRHGHSTKPQCDALVLAKEVLRKWSPDWSELRDDD